MTFLTFKTTDLTEITADTVAQAYNKTKTLIAYDAVQVITIAIALYILFTKFLKLRQQSSERNNGVPDMKSYSDLIMQYAIFAGLIAALPFVLSGLEAVLGKMQDLIIQKIYTTSSPDYETALWQGQLAALKETQEPSLWSMSISAIVDYFYAVYVLPFFAIVIHIMYVFYLCQRYLYLILLEIVAPIAIVMLLDDSTKSYFFQWLKHMIVCYLMIPAIYIALALSVMLNMSVLSDSDIGFFSMLFRFALQLSLLNAAKRYVMQLL